MRRASGVEGRGGTHPEARGGASGPPHPSLPPQGGRERRTRIAREDDRSGGTAQGRGKAIRAGAGMALINGRARPDCACRERRARPFPDSSPPPGERIKERGDAPRKRSRRERGDAPRKRSRRQRGGTHPEARGGASGPPHPPLSPQGERETRTNTARADDRSGGTARGNDKGGASGCCLSPPRVAIAWRQGRASRIPFS